ncbi:hypothetical protein BC629DRAFT_1637246 [Irpex lacteus]|nr:hypothetical protein BC629DRAFT_1637246 [Irpex lacteus]
MLKSSAKLPPLAAMQNFIKTCALSGASGLGIEGVQGWSYQTTQKFTATLFGMLYQHQVETPTTEYREQITLAIKNWAKKDKIINTHRKPKHDIHLVDYIRIKSIIHQSAVDFTTHFQSTQISLLIGELFGRSSRSGQFVEGALYAGTNMVTQWGHIIVIIEDWGSDGPTIWVIYEFHFMKGKKDDDSAIMYSVSHTIANTKAHYDTVLELVAIVIHLGVFEVDLRSWLTRPDLRPPKHMKIIDLLDKSQLNHLLGHSPSSNLATTTYQTPAYIRDVSALHHGEGQNMMIPDLLFSRAGSNKSSPVETQVLRKEKAALDANESLQAAKKAYGLAESKVQAASGGRSLSDLVESDDVDTDEDYSADLTALIQEAQEAWTTLMDEYCRSRYKSIDLKTTFAQPNTTKQAAPVPRTGGKEPLRLFTKKDLDNLRHERPLVSLDGNESLLSDEARKDLQMLEDSHPLLPSVDQG